MKSSRSKHVRKTKATDNKGLNLSTTTDQNKVNILNKKIGMHKKLNNESTSSTFTPQNNLMDPQIRHQNQRPQYQNERPPIQQPRSFIAEVNNNTEQPIDYFLESHWDMGQDFILEQSKNFNVQSLLTCLYRLKSENVDLDDELSVLMRRGSHILAEYNQNLASQNDDNCAQATPITNNLLELSLQNHSKPNKHTIPIFPNNVPSQVVFKESAAQEPRQDDQNAEVLRFNLDPNIALQSLNIAKKPNIIRHVLPYITQSQSGNSSSDSTTEKPKILTLPNIIKKSKTSRRNRKRDKKVESTCPSGNSLSLTETKVENKSFTGKKQQNLEYSESKGTMMATNQKIKNVMSISKSENNQNPNDEPIDLMAGRNAPDTSGIKSPLYDKQVPNTESVDNNGLFNKLNLLSTTAQNQNKALNENIEMPKKVNKESSLLNNRLGDDLMALQIHRQNLPETLQIQESASSSFKNGTKVLKDFVDKQWKEGEQFMIDKAQKFDIASLLTCLHELKSENVELEDELDVVRKHRDKLLAEKGQYETPPIFDYSLQRRYQNSLTPNGHECTEVHHSPNNTPSQAVSQDGVEVSRLKNRRPIVQNMKALSSNPMYTAVGQQSLNITLPPIRQTEMNNQPNHD